MRLVAIRPSFVADRWHGRYASRPADDPLNDGRTWPEVEEQIRALPADASVADINAVIGNHSWTPLQCAECGTDIQRGVHLGYELDHRYSGSKSYRRWGAVVCAGCLEKAAVALASNWVEEPL